MSFQAAGKVLDGKWTLSETTQELIYRMVSPESDQKSTDPTRLTAVPHFAWANREAGPLRVWLRARRAAGTRVAARVFPSVDLC